MPASLARRSAARLGLALTFAGLILPAPGCARMRAQHAPRSWAPSLLGHRAAHDPGNSLTQTDPPEFATTATPVADTGPHTNFPARDAFAERLAQRLAPAGALTQTAPSQAAPTVAPAALADLSASPAPSPTRATTPPAGGVLAASSSTALQAPPPPDLPPLDPPLAASSATSSNTIAATSPTTTAPAPTAATEKPASAIDTIRDLVATSSRQVESFRSYQVTLTRQERVGTNLLPEETVLLSIRREPRAVRLEWPDGPNQGREVLYAADANGGGMMHVKMPNALLPRLSLPPDSPLALKNSRHPITDAGLEYIVAGLQETVNSHVSGTAAAGDRLTYEGLVAPTPDLPPGHCIKRVTPTGETWVVTLDASNHLPVLIEGTAPNGDRLERYVFRKLQSDLPALAAADAFDPDARWGAPRGLLGRLARGNPESDAASTSR